MSTLSLAKNDPNKPENLSDHNREKFKGLRFRYTFPKAFDRKIITIEAPYKKAKSIAIELNKIRDSLTQEMFENIVAEFSSTGSVSVTNSTAVTDDLLNWREAQKENNLPMYNAIHDDTLNKENHKRLCWNVALRFARYCDEKRISSESIDKLAVFNFWSTLPADTQKKNTILIQFLDWITANSMNSKLDRWDYLPSSKGGRLHYKNKDPETAQVRIKNMDEFWSVYRQAGDMNKWYLQDAMLLALYTTMREGDVVTLRRDNGAYDGEILRKSILKSHSQKGEAMGTNLYFDLSKHSELAFLLNRMDQRAKKMNDCPFFVCHLYERVTPSRKKIHDNQVLKDYLQADWTEVRDATGLWDHLNIEQRPGFNQIRSLSAHLAKQKFKYKMTDISASMAHTDPKDKNAGAPITHRYTDVGYEIKWTEHTLVMKGTAIQLKKNIRQEIIESKPTPATWKGITPIQLQRLLWTQPITVIAEEYGISDRTVHNVAKRMNLIKPGSGFWTKVAHRVIKNPRGEIMMEHAQ